MVRLNNCFESDIKVILSFEIDATVIKSGILCPMISSIPILLNYSIFINLSGFKRCSLKSMNIFQAFSVETIPLAYQVLIHG